ncbi:MAG TPA: winged helix-turn-helix domain-containing protein [Candidatus Bathyarchaeia archaeon]|nr:winged helix-turn-helix domain-containing protein [Candidatus Bathyarchaeia archaeon]
MTGLVIVGTGVGGISNRTIPGIFGCENGIIRKTIGAIVGSDALGAMYQLLRFGVFELNLDLEEIRKNGTLLKLPPQPFKLLAMLANRSGQVVTRDEIQEQLWGSDTFIDFEQGVNKCIKQIRSVLGDNPDNPLYIETIPRHGYRFLAPVRTKLIPAPPPQVKEASSGLIANVAREVQARVQEAAAPAEATAHPRAQQAPSQPAGDPAFAPHSRTYALVVGLFLLVALLVGVAVWLLQH